MRIRDLITCCWLITAVCVPAALGQSPCLVVDSTDIRGIDLARALPVFSGIPPEVPIAQAPLPGSTRTFSVSELQSLGSRFSVRLESPGEVCFRIATQPLDRDRVAEAMRASLGIPPGDVQVTIIETIAGLVPAGTMEFPRATLGAPASPDQRAPVLWRGDIVYNGSRRFAIWAKVRITVPVRRVVAVANLKPGVIIEAGQIRTETVEGFPVVAGQALTMEQMMGLAPLRSVAAGDEVRADNLKQPNVINRGDLVRVEVRRGSTHLVLNGLAESAGHTGDMIQIRNPDTSRTFRGRVQSKGNVLVDTTSGGEN